MAKDKKRKIIYRLSAAVLCLITVLSQLVGTAPWNSGVITDAAETNIPLRRISGSGKAFIYHSFEETTVFEAGKTYAFLDDIYKADDAVSALGAGAILKALDKEPSGAKHGSEYYMQKKYGKTAKAKVYVAVVTPGKDFDYCPNGGLYQVPNTQNPTQYRYFCWKGGAYNCGPYYAYTYVEESIGYTDVSAVLKSIENQSSEKSEDYTVSITYNGNQTKVLDPGSYEVKFTAPYTVTFVISDSVGNSVTAKFKSPLTVRYDGNSENAGNVPFTQAAWNGESSKISSQTPTRSGYSFVNWKDAEANTNYSAGQRFTPAKSLRLSAQWKDIQPPAIGYTPIQVMTGDSDDAVKNAVRAALTVTDNEPVSECTATITLPTGFTKTPGNKNATVKVTDKADNTATKSCSVYVSSYVDIGKPVFTASTKKLTATLNNPGTDTVTASGFVWGVMNSPSLTVNNAKATTATVVGSAGGEISVTANDLQKGVEYYARAYITAGGITYYSEEITIGLGLPAHGTFTIKNNGSSTFTVTRTGGTEGQQTVCFRTVNGSAAGGTHFTHKSGTLIFNSGETAKTVTITEKTANTAYINKPATAYSNADRTYSVEIYRVIGGGSLGTATSATRSMKNSSSYEVNRTVYNETERTVSLTDSNKWIADHSGTGDWKIYFQNDREKNTNQINFNAQQSINSDYLKATASGFLYRSYFSYTEQNDGYHLAWISNHAPNGYGPSTISSKSAIPLNNSVFGSAYFTATWESGKNATVSLPAVTGASNVNGTNAATDKRVNYNGNTWISFGVNETANIWFSSAGADKDIWYMTMYKDYMQVQDTVEPQLVAVAPMANGGAYKIGDKFTVSLIFDEIVDKKNSTNIKNVKVNTSWGTVSYAGGADTNVLYFTGTVATNASGKLTVNSITNPAYINDMCDSTTTKATASGSGNTTATLDTSTPNFTVTANGITNGTGKATVKVTADRSKTTGMSYAWSDSVTVPTKGWVALSATELDTAKTASGLSLSIRKEPGSGSRNGKWYIHVKGVYDTTGYTVYKNTYLDFGTAASPAAGSTTPTLTAEADNTNWAVSRSISITAKGGGTLKYRKSDATSWTMLTSNATNYSLNRSVTENGYYTFLLTTGDITITKTVLVERIDRENPTASIGELTSASTQSPKSGVYTKLVLPITYADTGSGVNTVQYSWTNSTATPTSWTTLGKNATTVTYTASESTPTAKYLHIWVLDGVGNTCETYSSSYTVISQTAVKNHTPTITITGAPTKWTNDTATLNWKLSNDSGKNYEVILPDGKTSKNSSGEVWARQNGDYTVTVRDLDYGGENTAAIKVDKLDFIPPTVTVSGLNGWSKDNQTVTITASDAQSGVGEKWYKIVSNNKEAPAEGLTKLTGSTITVRAEGQCYIYYKIYDNSGDTDIDREANKTEGFRLVQIDKTAPTVNFGDYSAAAGMTVTVSDSTSKLASVTYKIGGGIENSVPNVNGQADITFTVKNLPAGDNDITVTVTDNAGLCTTSIKSVHVEIVSVDIAWGDMEFTYSDGIWNSATHTYDGVGWKPNETDGNKITVQNSGEAKVSVSYDYTQADTAVSGIFSGSSKVSLSAGDSASVWLVLKGKPSETMSKKIIGTATVKIGDD